MVVSSIIAGPTGGASYGHIETNTDATSAPVIAIARDAQRDPKNVEAAVREYFADIPVMTVIAGCESHYRQVDADGNVIHGLVDWADTGVMQINARYHAARAKSLGLDLNDLYDNMAYARILYDEQGTAPWKASASCWQKTLASR